MGHKHDFRPQSHTGPRDQPIIGFQCDVPGCLAHRDQPASPALTEALKEDDAQSLALHAVWHDFIRTFRPDDGPYLKKGYDLMEAVDEWAAKYPEDVRVVHIDDSYYSNSSMVLVEHKTPTYYMGTTVVVIPQLSGPPCEFFLYPRDRQDLMGALQAIEDHHQSLQPAILATRLAFAAVWNAETFRGS